MFLLLWGEQNGTKYLRNTIRDSMNKSVNKFLPVYVLRFGTKVSYFDVLSTVEVFN